jgi:diguanylate cyclase (GGDEF)-like protein
MIARLLEYRHSLRFKITAALLAILTISIGSAMFGIWTYEREQFIDITNDSATRIGQTVVNSLRTAMMENNRAAVQVAVNEIIAIYDSPSRLSIINPEGLVAVSSDPALLGINYDRFASPDCVVCHRQKGLRPENNSILIESESGQILRHITSIPNEPQCYLCHPESTKILGVLLYDADFSRTYQILKTVFIRMFLTGLVTFLAIGVVLFLAIDKFIHKPTTKLMEGFIQVGQGNYNFWVEENSSSEFAYMASQFNVMSRAIGRFIAEIKEKNKETDILYSIVREVSETIEWDRLKFIIVNLIHDIFRTEQGGLVIPQLLKKDCFDIVWRDMDEKRLGHLVYCLGKGELSLASISGAELEEWQRDKYSAHRFLDDYQRLLIPLFYQNEALGLICIRKLSGQRFSPHERAIAPSLAKHVAISLANAQLYHQAITDGLTGLYSRRHLFSKLDIHIARQSKYSDESFILLMLDLDHFKEVNDTFGHEAGDRVLIQMAELLRQNLRLVDIPFRYGGEEFVILVPTVKDQSALGMEIAERLRGAVERHDFECFGGTSTLKKTVSIGVSCFPMHGSTAHEVIRAADKAMYLAKTTGRNRVCAAALP